MEPSAATKLSLRPRRRPFWYMRSGGWPFWIVSSLITTSLIGAPAVGTSYMMSSIASSRIARRPRAPDLCFERLARRPPCSAPLVNLQLHAVHLEQLLVLLHQRVLRLGQDVDQRVLVELVQRRDHRQAADELGDHAELEQVLGLHLARAARRARRSFFDCDLGAEADAAAGRRGAR